MTLLQAWFWPDVSTRKNALHAIDEAFWVTVAVAVYWTLFALVRVAGDPNLEFDLFMLVDPALLAAAAVGIRLKSRVAAISSLGIYACVHLFSLLHPSLFGTFLFVMVSLALLHGVRGTVAFHRFAPIPENTPNIEKSFQAFGSKHAESEPKAKRK